MAVSLEVLLWALGQQESGGSYSAVKRGSGAAGKYQVMPENIGPWSLKYFGRQVTTQEFLHNPVVQEAVAHGVFGDYYRRYGDRGALAAWYSGNPKRASDYSHVGSGPSVGAYVDQVLGRTGGYAPTTRHEPNTSTYRGGAAAAGSGIAEQILNAAMGMLGKPYKWGGTTAAGVDCSGLLFYALNSGGFKSARYRAIDYGRMGTRVAVGDARPGDIVYYDNPGTSTDHVGIYLGSGKFIEAPQPGDVVKVSSLRGGAVIRRILPQTAWNGMTKDASGRFTYHFNNSQFVGATAVPFQDSLDQYGFIGTLARMVPELRGKLQEATANGWTVDRFTRELQDTKWWKSHPESFRQRIVQHATDPSTYGQERKQVEEHVRAVSAEMGIPLTLPDLSKLVGAAFNFGWQDEQIRRFVGLHGQISGQRLGGEAAKIAAQVKQMAYQYGVSVSQVAVDTAVRTVMTGQGTVETYLERYKQLAKHTFPGLAQEIDGGATVQELADPYIQQMAQTLEVDPAAVGVHDRLVRSALQYRDPAGVAAPLPLWQFEQQLKKDPRWDKTKNANEATYGILDTIGKNWGFRAA